MNCAPSPLTTGELWDRTVAVQGPVVEGGDTATMVTSQFSVAYVHNQKKVTDFRELNKRLVRKPFPLPKISTVLQELEGFTFATALDLNMGYYTIRLDPDASRICTIIFPWGKYSYKRLPMGVAGSPDNFQSKMSELMATLEFVRTYLDDLLCITKGDLKDHLSRLKEVFYKLQDGGLKVNANKSKF